MPSSILPILNFLAATASTTGGILALVSPSSLTGVPSSPPASAHNEIFYVRMYAARAIPLGLVSGILPLWYQRQYGAGDAGGAMGPGLAGLLFVAAVVQGLDVVIGAAEGRAGRGMMAGAGFATVVHALYAWDVL